MPGAENVFGIKAVTLVLGLSEREKEKPKSASMEMVDQLTLLTHYLGRTLC